jgi:hypothetical protein
MVPQKVSPTVKPAVENACEPATAPESANGPVPVVSVLVSRVLSVKFKGRHRLRAFHRSGIAC